MKQWWHQNHVPLTLTKLSVCAERLLSVLGATGISDFTPKTPKNKTTYVKVSRTNFIRVTKEQNNTRNIPIPCRNYNAF